MIVGAISNLIRNEEKYPSRIQAMAPLSVMRRGADQVISLDETGLQKSYKIFKLTNTGANPYEGDETDENGTAVSGGLTAQELFALDGSTTVPINTLVLGFLNPVGSGNWIFVPVLDGITVGNDANQAEGSTADTAITTIRAVPDTGIEIRQPSGTDKSSGPTIHGLPASDTQSGFVEVSASTTDLQTMGDGVKVFQRTTYFGAAGTGAGAPTPNYEGFIWQYVSDVARQVDYSEANSKVDVGQQFRWLDDATVEDSSSASYMRVRTELRWQPDFTQQHYRTTIINGGTGADLDLGISAGGNTYLDIAGNNPRYRIGGTDGIDHAPTLGHQFDGGIITGVTTAAAPAAAGASYGATEQTLLNDLRQAMINMGIWT